ncbi:MAG: cell division inhibitor SulA [Phenylobacterium sp.]|jgi:cell division inhibitor SulA
MNQTFIRQHAQKQQQHSQQPARPSSTRRQSFTELAELAGLATPAHSTANGQFEFNQSPVASSHNHQHNRSNDSSDSTLNNTKQFFAHQVKTNDELEATFELVKILCQFQHSNRWTLLVAPENIPDKALLNCCAVDMDRVLVVHEKQITNVLSTIENALSHATCSAVIAWCNTITPTKLTEINRLAEQSRCHFYAFNKHGATI